MRFDRFLNVRSAIVSMATSDGISVVEHLPAMLREKRLTRTLW